MVGGDGIRNVWPKMETFTAFLPIMALTLVDVKLASVVLWRLWFNGLYARLLRSALLENSSQHCSIMVGGRMEATELQRWHRHLVPMLTRT